MACKVCQQARRRKSIGAMKSKKMTNTLVDIAAGTAGLIGAQMLNKIPFIGANPQVGAAVKIAAGVIAAGATRGTMQKVAMGIALGGGVDLAQQFITPAVSGIGYLGVSRGSTAVSQVAGYGPIVD